MIPDGYLPPLRNTGDIPVQRSVYAMGVSAPADPTFKPYVYRGTGVDQIEHAAWAVAEAEREREAERKREVEKAALRERARRARLREKAKRRERAAREQREIDSIPHLIDSLRQGIERAVAREEKRHHIERKTCHRKRRMGQPVPARPSPGWQPLTISDIDNLLAEFDAET